MRFQAAAVLLATASRVAAQSVVGEAYGFATGVTGGGDAAAVTPTTVEELSDYLSDDEPRVILIDQEFDMTGEAATDVGCTRTSCTIADGGQYFLGDLSCGGDGEVADDSIPYNTGGLDSLKVGSNKSILGVGGQGVLIGKGLSLLEGASNVIIQGLEITNINPSVVWGGDAIELRGQNDGVWIDHCKISLIGRMFIVSHYYAVRLTISNTEFDGVTETSSSCNNDHYWTMMFYGDGDQVTLDKNYLHDVSGRAPKLGEDGVSGTFQATNNLFSNMEGHAFDAYEGATALIEGNVFESVSQPTTETAASVNTLYTVPDESAASACSSAIGRACALNSVDSSSGELATLSDSSVLSTFGDLGDSLVEPMDAGEVSAYVQANAGPANLGAASSSPAAETETETETETEVEENVEAPADPAPAAPAPESGSDSSSESGSSSGTVAVYGQCGGNGFSGDTKCASGATCTFMNDWYSQCVPGSSKARRAAFRRFHAKA